MKLPPNAVLQNMEPGSLETSIHKNVDRFFRHESGKLKAALHNLLGPQHLDLIEDVVQETMLKAIQHWATKGSPEAPSSWMFFTARNVAIDQLRKLRQLENKATHIAEHLTYLARSEDNSLEIDQMINDDVLRTMFTCCDPALSPETQVALTLKIIGGLKMDDIATALLKGKEATSKSIQRGKERLKQVGAVYDLTDQDIKKRTDSVLSTVYLLFNNGYKAATGLALTSDDLCLEAIRLAKLICRHPLTTSTKSNAFLALLLFQTARLPARVSQEGQLILLKDQDRSLYAKAMINEGLQYLNKASEGDEISAYHLQAGIAACHTYAPSFASTDWQLILEHFDALLEFNNSYVVQINRLVAMMYAKGSTDTIQELKKLEHNFPQLTNFYPYFLLKAELEISQGNINAAQLLYQRAIPLMGNSVEQQFVEHRLKSLLTSS